MQARGTRMRAPALIALVVVGAVMSGAALLAAILAGEEPDTLRGAAPRDFAVGAAVAGGGHYDDLDPRPFPDDVEYRRLLAREFGSLTPENQLKWQFVQPEQGVYDFSRADAIVTFARRHRQIVRGHTLLWHRQNPEWLEEGDFSPDELREILREHIATVVGRYAGRIQQWDVANEILGDGGAPRTQENIWIRELGIGIVAEAFHWAHQADPDAQLFLNDYDVEGVNAKSTAYLGLVEDLLERGVPVHGFGVQGHFRLLTGFDPSLEANLQRFDDLGLATAITEVDVRVPLPEDGLPTQEQLADQADIFRRALQACLDVAGCRSFTLWGFTDRYSWVPRAFPEEGAATILWEGYERKPAYDALHRTLGADPSGGLGSSGSRPSATAPDPRPP